MGGNSSFASSLFQSLRHTCFCFQARQPCVSAAQHQMNMAADARLSAIGYRLSAIFTSDKV